MNVQMNIDGDILQMDLKDAAQVMQILNSAKRLVYGYMPNDSVYYFGKPAQYSISAVDDSRKVLASREEYEAARAAEEAAKQSD